MNLYQWPSVVLSLFFYFNAVQSFAIPQTWVSGTGDDNMACTYTAPCKTFNGALGKTDPGGEIICLDSGQFGLVTINQSVSIYCKPTIGAITAPGANAIIINANASDKVVLDGVELDGAHTGFSGLQVLQAQSVTIANSSISNFTVGGINVIPSANTVNVTVINSLITGNGTGVIANASSAVANVGLINSDITGNTNSSSTSGGGQIVSYVAGNVLKN